MIPETVISGDIEPFMMMNGGMLKNLVLKNLNLSSILNIIVCYIMLFFYIQKNTVGYNLRFYSSDFWFVYYRCIRKVLAVIGVYFIVDASASFLSSSAGFYSVLVSVAVSVLVLFLSVICINFMRRYYAPFRDQ